MLRVWLRQPECKQGVPKGGCGGTVLVAGAALEALLAVRECQLETRTISIMERIEEVIECKGHGHG